MGFKRAFLVFVVLIGLLSTPAFAQGKAGIDETIAAIRPQLIQIADFIHENPESGNKEFKAVALLTKTLAENGFVIEMPVAGLETAFVATYKTQGEVRPFPSWPNTMPLTALATDAATTLSRHPARAQRSLFQRTSAIRPPR